MSSQPAQREQQSSTTSNTYTGASEISNGEATLMILIGFFIVFFAITVLYFRAKYSRARAADEHLLHPPLAFAPDSRAACAPRRRRPLDPSILKALPVFSVFPSEDFKLKGVPLAVECAVCLSEFAGGDKARLLPKCGHWFHVECIDVWFRSNSTCPLCRLPVALASSDEPTVGSPARSEVVSTKIVDAQTSTVVNIDEGSSSSSSSSSSSWSWVLSRGCDMLVDGSRGCDIEEGVVGVPVPNSSMS